MIDIDLSSGDLEFVNGDIKMIDGLAAIRQRVLIRLRTRLGEWAYDLQTGLDYFGEIIGQTEFSAARARILALITSTPGVAAVTEVTAEYDRRTRTVCFGGAFLADPAFLTDAERAAIGLEALRSPVTLAFGVAVDSGELNLIMQPIGSF